MNRNGDKSPSMDLDELLRRHDQFKQRQARTPGPAPRPQTPAQQPEIKKPAPVETPAPVVDEPAAPAEAPVETVIEEAPVQPAPVEDVAVEFEDAPEQYIEDADGEAYDGQPYDEDGYDDEVYDDEAEPEKDPNPFDSMFSIFRTAFSKLRRKKGKDEEDFLEDEFEDDVVYEDDMADDAEPATDQPSDKARPAEAEPFVENEPAGEDIPSAPAEDIEDLEDIPMSEPTETEPAEEPSDDDFIDDIDDDEADEQSKKKKGLFGWLKKKKNIEEEESFEFDDSDFADENYVAEEFPDKEELLPEDEPVDPMDFDEEPAIEAPAADVEDLADFEDLPAKDLPEHAPVDFEDDTAPAGDDFDDDDFDDDEDNEIADANQPSGFRKFLSLFVVREDDEEVSEEDDDDWDEDDDWSDRTASNADFIEDADSAAHDCNNFPADAPDPAPSAFRLFADDADIEGGTTDMDEKNRVNTELTELLAAGLESQGMSRRERRELAARMAAEEAAKRAAEEAAKPVIETAPAEEPIVVEAPVELAPVEVAEEPVVESFDAPDEPTRIFKPLTSLSRAAEEPAPAIETPAAPVDDEDDDEEEETGKRRTFSFFRKKRAEEDEDEEDYEEDEEDDYDEDEEEEEPVEKKPRRGLFAKKSRAVKYDEDEEEFDEDEDDDEDGYDDEDDDEDDYDEYDDFDDEDDDEDDYDDEDDDYEDSRPLGIRIIGFFKGLFAFILCVLIVVFALNFLDYFNVLPLDSVFEHHYNKAPAVFDTLFPSHNLKNLIKPGETIQAIEPIEDVNTNVGAAATQAPVSVTPVPEAAPATVVEATEAPAVVG